MQLKKHIERQKGCIMEIDIFAHRYPPDPGGIERHVQELARFLQQREHDVTVHVTRWKRDQQSEQVDNGIKIHRYRAIAPNEGYYIAPQIALQSLRSSADLIHAHGYHSLPFLFAILGSQNKPTVVTPHYNGKGSNQLRQFLHKIYKPVAGLGLKKADRVISVSEWEAEALRQNFGIKSTVIPNGISTQEFNNTCQYVWPNPYILSIGRLERSKGVQHTVRALAKLPEYDLLIAGDGQYREALEQIASQLGVDDRVHFLGHVDSNVPALYAGAEAHVFLSEHECFGLTAGESLASGTPCVVRDATALSEWTDYTGCIGISSTNPDAVAAAIERAVCMSTDPSEILTWDQMGEKLLDIYYKLV